jgi:hypothetical protein
MSGVLYDMVEHCGKALMHTSGLTVQAHPIWQVLQLCICTLLAEQWSWLFDSQLLQAGSRLYAGDVHSTMFAKAHWACWLLAGLNQWHVETQELVSCRIAP